MVVTTRTRDRQRHKNRGGRLHTISDVFKAVFLVYDPPLRSHVVVPVKSGGNLLIERRSGKQIPGELFRQEPIKRQVPVESMDHPIPVTPVIPRGVIVVTIRVRIPGSIQPSGSHMFPETIRPQQPVHHGVIGRIRCIRQECVDLIRSRQQPGQREGHPPNQDLLRSLRGRHQTIGIEPVQNKRVHSTAEPRRIRNRRQRGLSRRNKRPMPGTIQARAGLARTARLPPHSSPAPIQNPAHDQQEKPCTPETFNGSHAAILQTPPQMATANARLRTRTAPTQSASFARIEGPANPARSFLTHGNRRQRSDLFHQIDSILHGFARFSPAISSQPQSSLRRKTGAFEDGWTQSCQAAQGSRPPLAFGTKT